MNEERSEQTKIMYMAVQELSGISIALQSLARTNQAIAENFETLTEHTYEGLEEIKDIACALQGLQRVTLKSESE